MRTSALQYLYLQKPVSSVILVCLISFLPWIALGDFSTKGEPREAAVAVSMLESGNWMLPDVYAGEFAYKPPVAHWLMALFSLPQGFVTPFTARLPSALACTALLTVTLLFFGRKTRFQEAFIATLLLFTCLEIHRAGMTARVDMLLTFFTVFGLMQLFRWEDELELKGLPVIIPALLSAAILTKGPVGLALPLFIFGVYLLLLRRYTFPRICKALAYITVASLFIPSLWYIEAWREGGSAFLNVALAENFGRFFHLDTPQIHYTLGHENGAWYNLLTLAAGFLPWTLLLFLSLFGMKVRLPAGRWTAWLPKLRQRLQAMDRVKLFSLTAVVCTLLFYSFPSSKRSVYLMPAYPFLALFISQFFLYLAERRALLIRLFAGLLAGTVSAVAVAAILQTTGLLDVCGLVAGRMTGHSAQTLRTVAGAFVPGSLSLPATGVVLLFSLATVFYHLRKKINIKILYATLFLVCSAHLFIDGVVMQEIRREGSARVFAGKVLKTPGVNRTNLYVMNDLRTYTNLYGMNFYLGNCFRNFETDSPQSGFFLATENDFHAVAQRYAATYDFHTVCVSDRIISDVRSKIVLSRFTLKQTQNRCSEQ